MTQQTLLAEGIDTTRAAIARFYKGFDDTNHTTQAPNLPNHFAWTLGHLAFVAQRQANNIDGLGMSAADFASGDPKNRYDLDAISPASVPVPDPQKYPTCARCIEIFDRSTDRLVAAIRSADDGTMAKPVKFGPMEIPLYTALLRTIYHTGLHAGQLADLRRALNLGYVLLPPRT